MHHHFSFNVQMWHRAECPSSCVVYPDDAQVEGCGVDVSSQKEQNKRYRICDFHVKSEFVKWEGKIHRFCQQCSRMQLLNEFDGQKRSCRESLEKIGFKRRTKSMDTQVGAMKPRRSFMACLLYRRK